ncbi:hypothetical protein K0M31_003943 [Melipona bicolor]|uniref:Secreted protein n=1 Tax=Melipona bicolor TaxID=60889 RepID=A0AA40FXU5_9HYME|nr:hypothetical protein K0M31_003943 [Melipona bicolor]
MLGTRLCVFLKVLALAGSVSALLPEDFEDRAAPANLQEECASKCPDLDLNQNRTDDSSSEVGCGIRCKIDQGGSLARSKEYKEKARDKRQNGERIPIVAGRIFNNACLQGREREPQLTRPKGQKASRYT